MPTSEEQYERAYFFIHNYVEDIARRKNLTENAEYTLQLLREALFSLKVNKWLLINEDLRLSKN